MLLCNKTLLLCNLVIWFGIWKGLTYAAIKRLVNHISAFHVSPVLDLISILNWFDSAIKLQHGGYLFDNKMMTKILVKTRKHIGKEVHQRHQERAISYHSKYKINKSNWVCISYSDPQNPKLIFGSLVLIKRLFCFSRGETSQVKSSYFKHWSEQLKVLNDLSELMKKVNITHGKQILLAGDFTLFFDSNLEAKETNSKRNICCQNDRVNRRIWSVRYLEN